MLALGVAVAFRDSQRLGIGGLGFRILISVEIRIAELSSRCSCRLAADVSSRRNALRSRLRRSASPAGSTRR